MRIPESPRQPGQKPGHETWTPDPPLVLRSPPPRPSILATLVLLFALGPVGALSAVADPEPAGPPAPDSDPTSEPVGPPAPTKARNRPKQFLFVYKHQRTDTGARGFLLWPLIQWERSAELQELAIRPFYSSYESAESEGWSVLWPLLSASRELDREGRSARHFHALPFIWRDESADSSRTISPLFYHSRDDREDSARAWALPSFWFQRDGEAWSWHLFPLLGFGRQGLHGWYGSALYPLFRAEMDEPGGKIELDMLWPLAGVRSDTNRGESRSWSPLHYHQREADGSGLFLSPLLFSARDHDGAGLDALLPLALRSSGWLNSGADDLITPLFFHRRRRSSGATTLVTLAGTVAHDSRSRQIRAWLPFGWQENGPRYSRLITPLFVRSHDLDEDSEQTHLPPFIWTGREGSHDWQLIAPFWFSEGTSSRRTRVLAPFLWQQQRSSGRGFFHLAPFWWSAQDPAADKEWSVLAPFYADFRDGERRDRAAFPGVFFGSSGDSSYLHVAPFWWSSRQGEERSFQALAPFYWHSRTPRREHRILAPFYFAGEDREAGTTWRHLAPLWFSHRGPDSELTIAPPWLYQRRDGDGLTRAVTPLYWELEDAETGSNRILAPLWWSGSRAARDRDWQLLLPFFLRTHDGARDRVVTPLSWWSRDRIEGTSALHLPPFWWSSTSDFDRRSFQWLFPLAWRSRSPESSELAIAPLWYSGDDHETGASTRALVPFYYSSDDPTTGSATRVLAPFWWDSRDGETGDQTRALLPFGAVGENRRLGTAWQALAPLWFAGQSDFGASSWQTLPPLFWRSNSAESSSLALAPLWFSGRDKRERRSWQVLAPLFHHSATDDNQRSSTTILPVYHSARTESSEDLWTPLYAAGEDHQAGRSYLHLPPLWWSWRAQLNNRRSHFVAPMLWWSDDDERSDLALAPLWFSGGTKDGRESYRHLAPLLFHGASTDDEGRSRSWTVAPPLFYRFAEQDKVDLGIAPLAFYGHDRQGPEESGYLHLPPLYASAWQGESSWQTLLGLLWHSADAESHRTLLLPLLDIERSTDGRSSSTSLYPLMSYARDEDSRSLSVLWPLFQHSQGPAGTHSHALPLWWSDDEGERGRTIAFPLYWDRWTPERRDLHVWPFAHFARRKDGGRVYSTLWPLISLETNADGYALSLRPLYSRVRRTGYRSDALYPLFRRSTELGPEGDHTRFWMLWPLIRHESNLFESDSSVLGWAWSHRRRGAESHTRLLWRLWSSDVDPDEGLDSWLLGYGLLAREVTRDYSSLKLRPLVSWERKAPHVEGGGTYVSLLSGLASRETYGVETGDPDDDGTVYRLLGLPVYDTRR